MDSEQIFDDFQQCVRCRTPLLARRRVRSTLNNNIDIIYSIIIDIDIIFHSIDINVTGINDVINIVDVDIDIIINIDVDI